MLVSTVRIEINVDKDSLKVRMGRMIKMCLVELRRLINEKKQELYRCYREQGISSNVLKLSTDLDKLIYEYHLLSSPPPFPKRCF